MNFCLFDKAGASLQITTDIASHSFEAITCSPHADGFTVLNSLGIKSILCGTRSAYCLQGHRRVGGFCSHQRCGQRTLEAASPLPD